MRDRAYVRLRAVADLGLRPIPDIALTKELYPAVFRFPKHSDPGVLMTDAILSYRAMAYNNGWANHRLLAACARLSQTEFIAPRTGFFPSVRATLNHILVVDLFYVDAMEGGTLGPAAWADPEPCATMDALRQAQADCG